MTVEMPDGEYPQSMLRLYEMELEQEEARHDNKAEARINSPYTIYYIYPGVDEARVTRELKERNLKGLVTQVHYHKGWELCNARCTRVVPPNET